MWKQISLIPHLPDGGTALPPSSASPPTFIEHPHVYRSCQSDIAVLLCLSQYRYCHIAAFQLHVGTALLEKTMFAIVSICMYSHCVPYGIFNGITISDIVVLWMSSSELGRELHVLKAPSLVGSVL